MRGGGLYFLHVYVLRARVLRPGRLRACRPVPDEAPVWDALGRILDTYLTAWHRWEILSDVPAGVHILGAPSSSHRDCASSPGAVLRGPLIVGAGTEIRTGAYLRGRVVVGRQLHRRRPQRAEDRDPARRRPCSAPELCGRHDPRHAMSTSAPAPSSPTSRTSAGGDVPIRGRHRPHRPRKLGAILGDGCRTGCNTVLNPGVLMGPGCITYPNVCLRSGFYPARTLVKLRQTQQQIVLDKLHWTDPRDSVRSSQFAVRSSRPPLDS